jgi:hypothetical protein
MSADADPVAAYLTSLEDTRLGAVGEMGFTLEDFKTYIAGLRKVIVCGVATDVWSPTGDSVCVTRGSPVLY